MRWAVLHHWSWVDLRYKNDFMRTKAAKKNRRRSTEAGIIHTYSAVIRYVRGDVSEDAHNLWGLNPEWSSGLVDWTSALICSMCHFMFQCTFPITETLSAVNSWLHLCFSSWKVQLPTGSGRNTSSFIPFPDTESAASSQSRSIFHRSSPCDYASFCSRCTAARSPVKITSWWEVKCCSGKHLPVEQKTRL